MTFTVKIITYLKRFHQFFFQIGLFFTWLLENLDK